MTEANQACLFEIGARVMHPAHGVGTVARTDRFVVSGMTIDVLVAVFDDVRMELKIPLNRLAGSGLRTLCSHEVMAQALAEVGGKGKLGRGPWGRRAQDFTIRTNSGDPVTVAGVIRDAGRNYNSNEQSFSERIVLERAVDRLASELAALEGLSRDAAAARILGLLPPGPTRKAASPSPVSEIRAT